jgi:3-oxoadipate enol-lactonase / 4-carboxymuconolactone decarboxylase
MSFVHTASGNLYYRLEGAEGQPVVVLSHSLGLDHGMWDAQVEALAPHFRILRFDTRGHGASSVIPGDYTIEQLARDVLALADALNIQTFAFCGLSLGGMIGMWLAVHAADRVTHVVLANTTARVSDPSAMEARRKVVLDQGMAAVADVAMSRFFTAATVARNPPPVAAARRTLLATPAAGYAGCCAAIRDMDQRARLARISVQTLVISGDQDISMPWPEHGQLLASAIPGATVVRLDAAHMSNLEKPRAFSAALLEFLLPATLDQREAGMAMRRAVLGDAHVDRAIASATEFNRDFQDLITRFAWGAVWTRPGLDERTRRLLVLAITASMGRWEEFRMHLKAGIEHGLEWTDVEELLLQTGVYAGLPAANTGFHIAAELKRESKDTEV